MLTLPILLFLLTLGARFDLFLTGSLYSSADVLASDAILAGIGFWMATAIAARVLKDSSWEARLVAVGAAIGIPAAFVGLVEIVAPVTPAAATAPAWNAQTLTGPAIGQSTTLTLVASVCVAPGVLDFGNYTFRQFSWNDKTVVPITALPKSITHTDAQHLQTDACRIAPDYPKASP
jgi:hypothetical protein